MVVWSLAFLLDKYLLSYSQTPLLQDDEKLVLQKEWLLFAIEGWEQQFGYWLCHRCDMVLL